MAKRKQDAEIEQRMQNIGKAWQAVIDHIGTWKKGASERGSIKCPICSGTLNYARSGYNGHLHGHCTTNGCVSWKE